MAKKKTAPNKSEFIRSQPDAMTAAEVVTKGAEQGLTFKSGLVYAVRRNARTKAARTSSAPKQKRQPKPGDWEGIPTRKDAYKDTLKSQERQFVALVLDIGLARADGLMHELRNRLVGVV